MLFARAVDFRFDIRKRGETPAGIRCALRDRVGGKNRFEFAHGFRHIRVRIIHHEARFAGSFRCAEIGQAFLDIRESRVAVWFHRAFVLACGLGDGSGGEQQAHACKEYVFHRRKKIGFRRAKSNIFGLPEDGIRTNGMSGATKAVFEAILINRFRDFLDLRGSKSYISSLEKVSFRSVNPGNL